MRPIIRSGSRKKSTFMIFFFIYLPICKDSLPPSTRHWFETFFSLFFWAFCRVLSLLCCLTLYEAYNDIFLEQKNLLFWGSKIIFINTPQIWILFSMWAFCWVLSLLCCLTLYEAYNKIWLRALNIHRCHCIQTKRPASSYRAYSVFKQRRCFDKTLFPSVWLLVCLSVCPSQNSFQTNWPTGSSRSNAVVYI